MLGIAPKPTNALRIILQGSWLFVGLLASAIPFFKPVALGVAFFGLLALQGTYPGEALNKSFGHFGTLVVLAAVALFVTYWFCVGVLSYQFMRGKKLSRAAGGIVAVIVAAFIVVGRPWISTGKPFVPSPEDLFHLVFLFGLALYAAAPESSHRVAG